MRINLRHNNLDWLRLAFALQVALMHSIAWLEEQEQASFDVFSWLAYFPGVPAFFFLSGFLIYASYDKSSKVSTYFTNRFLRLWPGLIFVTFGGLLVVILGRMLAQDKSGQAEEYAVWFFSQITLGQAWNPPSFRNIGIGVINGSLWTITVEILFYLSVPVIHLIEKKYKYTVHLLLVLSLIAFGYSEGLLAHVSIADKSLYEYFALTPIIWGWMFLVGTLAYKNLENIERYFKYTTLGFPIILALIILDMPDSILFSASGNRLGVVYFLALSSAVLFLGFGTAPQKIKFDLSYGIYIWHAVVINLLIIVDWYSVVNVMLMTLMVASISWFFIEKPALKMKTFSLRA
jgi:peptidoglycan/LPS O-acetylase OafA/YrhL